MTASQATSSQATSSQGSGGGQPQPQASGANGARPGTGGGSGNGFDWSAVLGADNAPLLDVVKAKGWKTPADALKSYASLESTIGRDKVPLPKDDDPAEMDSFFAKLGMPADPAGYELKRPEGVTYSEEMEASFRQWARRARLTKAQAAALHDEFMGFSAQAEQARAKDIERRRGEVEAELRRELGPQFDGTIRRAQRIAADLGGDEFRAWLNESGVGNQPEMIRFFAKLGQMTAEDSAARGRPGSALVVTPEQARAEIDRIRGEAQGRPEHPLLNQRHPEHAALQERLNDLYRLIGRSGQRQGTTPRR
ncbi:hypothetical protein J4558_00030 [Leptolyngbya sp. 15MV]|nr:hypothetical protein J4558_00030 [Leptolyngbya sp. 15MV]